MGEENEYMFIGVVLPERAPLTFKISINIHTESGKIATFEIKILMNQIVVRVTSEKEFDLHELRDVVANNVQSQLDAIGFIKGYAYNLEITRVFSHAKGIDEVFGIDISDLTELHTNMDPMQEINKLNKLFVGENGRFIKICLRDLASAIRNPEDTAFYCYRAIESLRNHYASLNGLDVSDQNGIWEAFRLFSKIDKASIMRIKDEADPLRHGRVLVISGEQRKAILVTAWQLVDQYFNALGEDSD
jgi:hypothetical protein